MVQSMRVEVQRVNGDVELRARFASVEEALGVLDHLLRRPAATAVAVGPPRPPAAPPTPAVPSPPLNDTEAAVLNALRAGPLTGRAIRERLGLTQNQQRRVLEGLQARGLVGLDGEGGRLDPFLYRLTDQG